MKPLTQSPKKGMQFPIQECVYDTYAYVDITHSTAKDTRTQSSEHQQVMYVAYTPTSYDL